MRQARQRCLKVKAARTNAQKREREVYRGKYRSILTSLENRLRFKGKWQAEMLNEPSEFEIRLKNLIKHAKKFRLYSRLVGSLKDMT